MDPHRHSILFISNGHGEDRIAAHVAAQVRALGCDAKALPIVGEGQPYLKFNIPITGPTQILPSGGFIYMSWHYFWRDLRAGLGGLTWQQFRHIRQTAEHIDLIVAVGDIVVLSMARFSGAPFAFIGTAKSDFQVRSHHSAYAWQAQWFERAFKRGPCSVYFPWERWLMHSHQTKAIFPRDSFTARNLQRFHLPVFDLGNPMMDGLEAQLDPVSNYGNIAFPTLLLLPGSRPPEAYRNWQQLMAVVEHLPTDVRLIAAIASTLDRQAFHPHSLPNRPPITFISGQFGNCIHRASAVLAMAGTATEQCVGLGKPVVSIPGQGPQFTLAFAKAQARLLGPSLQLVTTGPSDAAAYLCRYLTGAPGRMSDLALLANGRERMGSPGASKRIASQILRLVEGSQS